MARLTPPILHRCVPAEVPLRFDGYWQAWQDLHPRWTFREYRDPIDPADWPLTGHLFADCVHGAQLAGLVRLEALWKHGGVYVDMDFEPIRAIDAVLALGCVIGTEGDGWLTDAFIAAPPEHPAIRACIDRVVTLSMAEGPDVTGPHNTTAALAGRPDVTVLAKDLLYPYGYHEPERAGDAYPDALAVHRWNASWVGG